MTEPTATCAGCTLFPALQSAWQRPERLHRRSGVPPRLSREGKLELTEALRSLTAGEGIPEGRTALRLVNAELCASSARLSPRGSLREMASRTTLCQARSPFDSK